MQIEQAIFTSARTRRMDGYQLVAASSGVSQAEATELIRWGPTHGSLFDSLWDVASINFHPLTDGTYCVSRTVNSGFEYSGRGGGRIYTHCLVADRTVLHCFANNPFRLLEAAVGSGKVAIWNQEQKELEPIHLVGKASVTNRTALNQLVKPNEIIQLALLCEYLVSSSSLGVITNKPFKQLVSNLFNILPIECRTQVSFTTGLRYSPSRPFRLFVAPGEWLASGRAVTSTMPSLLHLESFENDSSCDGDLVNSFANAWAALVFSLLANDELDALVDLLKVERCGLHLEGLNSLGEQLLKN